jgi:hypothetical protein
MLQLLLSAAARNARLSLAAVYIVVDFIIVLSLALVCTCIRAIVGVQC